MTQQHEHPYPHLTTHLKGDQCWCGEEDTVTVSLIDQTWTPDEIQYLIRTVETEMRDMENHDTFAYSAFVRLKLRELVRDDEFAYGTKFVMTNDPDTMDRVAKL